MTHEPAGSGTAGPTHGDTEAPPAPDPAVPNPDARPADRGAPDPRHGTATVPVGDSAAGHRGRPRFPKGPVGQAPESTELAGDPDEADPRSGADAGAMGGALVGTVVGGPVGTVVGGVVGGALGALQEILDPFPGPPGREPALPNGVDLVVTSGDPSATHVASADERRRLGPPRTGESGGP